MCTTHPRGIALSLMLLLLDRRSLAAFLGKTCACIALFPLVVKNRAVLRFRYQSEWRGGTPKALAMGFRVRVAHTFSTIFSQPVLLAQFSAQGYASCAEQGTGAESLK